MLSVSGIVILAKLLGFFKQMITAGIFGATLKTDMVFLSQGLILDFDYLLIQSLAIAFIPTYLRVKAEGPGNEKRFVIETIKAVFFISALIAFLLIVLSPFFAKIIAPSYSMEMIQQLSGYVRVFSPVLIMIVEAAVVNAALRANKIFIPGELAPVNQSVIIIVMVLLFGKIYGPDILVLATIVYAVYNILFLSVFAKKYFGRLSFSNPFTNSDVKDLLKMMGPLLIGYSIVFINQQVDRMIVSGLGAGTITAMNYAAVLSNFVSTFIGTLCGVLFSYVAQNVAEGKDSDAGTLTSNAAIQLITLFLPVSAITILNAKDIVSIVYGHGHFELAAVQSCALALTGYGLMFVPYVIRELYTRLQYAYNDSKTPMINSAISIAFNIIFSIVLSRYIGVLGVTIATSIAVFVSAVLNIFSAKKYNIVAQIVVNKRIVFQWIGGLGVCIIITMFFKVVFNSCNMFIRFLSITVLSLFFYGVITREILQPLLVHIKRNK